MKETITWHDAAHEVPDCDTTVLVRTPDGTEPVQAGFWGGAAWHTAEDPSPTITVTYWADWPEGPIG